MRALMELEPLDLLWFAGELEGGVMLERRQPENEIGHIQ